MSEFFWTADMGGVDWKDARAKYEPLVDRVASRAELSDLLWELYGELGVGHAYEFGGDHELPAGSPLGHLGADFSWDGRAKAWRIDGIVTGDPWDADRSSPLIGPARDVQVGDAVVAIDGTPLDASTPPRAALAGKAGTDVSLTFKRGRRQRSAVVRPLHDERAARYRQWVADNRARVHAETDGRAGYIHVPNMGTPGFGEFHRAFYAEFERDALVVDVRFNEGGFVSTLLLEKLLRRQLGVTVFRWRQPESYPRQAATGLIVGLCNEYTGSDGDLFSQAFRTVELGPLVGVRTWGGVIGINTKEPMADGTITAQPELAHWFPGIEYGLEGHGAEPTHPVEIHPGDAAAGRDRQLDEALRLVRRQLAKAKPPARPR
jgi:tricorn protease